MPPKISGGCSARSESGNLGYPSTFNAELNQDFLRTGNQIIYGKSPETMTYSMSDLKI